MEELIDLLREAFEAGSHSASEYEHGGRGYYPDFNGWCEQNKNEIERVKSTIDIDFKIRLAGCRLLLGSLLAETSGVPKPLHSIIGIELDKIKKLTDKL